MRVSVIVSTYNQPAWLRKVLWGFGAQTHREMEIVIADDGSGEETRRLVDGFRGESGIPVEHVWHEDSGFRKCAILNKATVAAHSEYLIFTDGDCIPRADFVAAHVANARPGWMLSGGYVKLPTELSTQLTRDDIVSGRAFDSRWLATRGVSGASKLSKLMAGPGVARLLNAITPTRASWNGHNSSGWKGDIVKVNGFDERMEYGGEDRELGERLVNAGVKAKQIRYSAVCVHLDHARAYRNEAAIEKNMVIRRATAAQHSVWTEYGIRKG